MLIKQEGKQINFQELTWQDVRNAVKKVNPTLFEIIEQLDPGKKFTFYKQSYPYGAKIVDKGQFHLIAESNELVPLNDLRVNKRVQKALGYRSIPLALNLCKTSEIFIEDDNRIVPMRLLKPGELFGIFEAIEPPNQEISASITNVSAGARSAFMLAKISDSASHKRLLKEFDLRSPLPRGLSDHGLIFSEIASHPQFSKHWQNEILFFSGEWLKKNDDSIGWIRLANYLHQVAWQQSEYWRSLPTFRLWKNLIRSIKYRNIRPRPYLVDTIKHLIFIATSAVPGFSPTGCSDLALPTKIIQEVYLESYLLKSHSPIIMAPYHYESTKAVYYSLSHPSLLEYSINPKQAPTIIEDMRELKTLIHLLEMQFESQYDFLSNLLKNINFNYFTCETDFQGKITPSAELPNFDSNFFDESRTFPAISTFLRGCIRISNK